MLLVNVTVVFCSKHRNNHVMKGKTRQERRYGNKVGVEDECENKKK